MTSGTFVVPTNRFDVARVGSITITYNYIQPFPTTRRRNEKEEQLFYYSTVLKLASEIHVLAVIYPAKSSSFKFPPNSPHR